MVTSLSYVQRSLEGKPSLVREDVELPEREPQQALVKITYVAQNPTDGERAVPIRKPSLT